MRIQILPLPLVTFADATHTPFVIVFDQIGNETTMAEVAELRYMAEAWGARGVLAAGGDDSIEVSPAFELPEELQQALLDHLNRPFPKETP